MPFLLQSKRSIALRRLLYNTHSTASSVSD